MGRKKYMLTLKNIKDKRKDKKKTEARIGERDGEKISKPPRPKQRRYPKSTKTAKIKGKPRVLMVSDVKGWGAWTRGRYIKNTLSDEFDFDLIDLLELDSELLHYHNSLISMMLYMSCCIY